MRERSYESDIRIYEVDKYLKSSAGFKPNGFPSVIPLSGVERKESPAGGPSLIHQPAGTWIPGWRSPYIEYHPARNE